MNAGLPSSWQSLSGILGERKMGNSLPSKRRIKKVWKFLETRCQKRGEKLSTDTCAHKALTAFFIVLLFILPTSVALATFQLTGSVILTWVFAMFIVGFLILMIYKINEPLPENQQPILSHEPGSFNPLCTQPSKISSSSPITTAEQHGGNTSRGQLIFITIAVLVGILAFPTVFGIPVIFIYILMGLSQLPRSVPMIFNLPFPFILTMLAVFLVAAIFLCLNKPKSQN